MPEDGEDELVRWYADVTGALREKPPAEVARELPGLVEQVADDADDVDHYAVGVSFTRKLGCLDYAVDRVLATEEDEDPVVESVKAPASESHRYVRFAHPPDPHFDAAALRARLIGASHRERQAARNVDAPTSAFADLWEQL